MVITDFVETGAERKCMMNKELSRRKLRKGASLLFEGPLLTPIIKGVVRVTLFQLPNIGSIKHKIHKAKQRITSHRMSFNGGLAPVLYPEGCEAS